ncbi:predicted protein [Plenodomus lingam JN3]|uniref:Predicted protein n=1 Tax=Leptosphaeria maculans (strain JN3 / isolate v23.1.3 / race Av1-4-5-6-7-8) TaxID=985895 RepID=E4ZQT0_LEPMJ|nr:predicted protein [Plenodomus lingam JN3]CBX94085.1 predicted protein [Plenodomus lingam JN3]
MQNHPTQPGPAQDNLTQPDFAFATQNLNNFAAEVSRIGNVPALQGQLDNIVQMVGGITDRLDRIDTRLDRMDTRLDGLDTRLDGLDTRLDGLDARLTGLDTQVTTGFARVDVSIHRIEENLHTISTRLDATNFNTFAALNNKLIVAGDAPLCPLHHATTNQPIPHFPETGNAIENLSVAQLDGIFRALPVDMPVNRGNKKAKITALRYKIGAITA